MTSRAPRLVSRLTSHPKLTPRRRVIALCAVPVAALFAVVAVAPLPYSVAEPGITADVLGAKGAKGSNGTGGEGDEDRGEPVISLDGESTSGDDDGGKLLMTTIAATAPGATVKLPDVLHGWFATDRAVMPTEAVYPVGDNAEEIREHNRGQMKKSQNVAVDAALRQLRRSPDDVDVTLRLADVGGPSAGLLFALGIIDKLDGDGRGGGLTGGRTIAGTGTIDAAGKIGPVGGVPLKTQAAKRDGATVFLVPEAECADALSVKPRGLRLVPVTTLDSTLDSLKALKDGDRADVPTC